MAGKVNRSIDTRFLQDPGQVEASQNNPAAGAKKTLPVGPRLLAIPYINTGTPAWTTDVSTRTALPRLGMNVAVYNNAGSVGSIVIGGSTITTLAPGATDSSGNVGVPCPPGEWTNLSMSQNQYIISSAATLLTFIVEDPTWITQETGPYAQQNGNV